MFEYDPEKSHKNKLKHGLDFEQAKLLWKDPRRVEIQASSTTEPRFMVIGKIEEKYWSAIITCRKENIRLISVRRSRPDEVKVYES
ncbi:MAG: BrnT family toxin [Xenococcus sp. (in: cyanobacteria)]